MFQGLLTASSLALLVSCTGAHSGAGAICETGDQARIRDTVYFGHNRPEGGIVSDAEWQTFLNEVVTPRFPEGLTVIDGIGQWRGAAGVVERERSHIVFFLHSGSPTDRQSISELAAEYKRRFHQEAVLRERAPSCVRFQ